MPVKKKRTTKKRAPEKATFAFHVDVPDEKAWKGRWYGFKHCGWVGTGISFGSALAMILSYARNESILWAILHGIISWLYVIYVAILKIGWF
jgi:hypothetical protein